MAPLAAGQLEGVFTLLQRIADEHEADAADLVRGGRPARAWITRPEEPTGPESKDMTTKASHFLFLILLSSPSPMLPGEAPRPEPPTPACATEEHLAKLAPHKSKVALTHYDALVSCLKNARDEYRRRLTSIAANNNCSRSDAKAQNSRSCRRIATQLHEVQPRLNRAEANALKLGRYIDFAGVNVGVGFAGAHHLGEQRIKRASLDSDRTVQVLETVEMDLRLVGVVRRFPWTWRDDNVGLGPFAIFNLGFEQTKLLTSLGAGLMMGVRTREKGPGLGIGVAYVIDTNVRALRDDFLPGGTAPPGETEIKWVSKANDSVLMVVSYDF